MRVLLTGGTGFIGAAVSRELIAQGHEVRGLVRKTSKTELLASTGAKLVQGDVGDRPSLDAALDGIDGVLHLAGVTKARSIDEFYRVNGGGTRKLAEACAERANPPRLVYVSSIAAGGPSTPERPRTEDEAPNPISHYGKSKLDGELAVRALASKLPAVICRPPIVFGPRDLDFFEVYKLARNGLVLKAGFGLKRFSIVHVDDLARGLARALTHGATVKPDGTGGLYHLSDPGAYTWEELGQIVAQSMGKRARVITVPVAVSLVAALGKELQGLLQKKPQILNLDKVREIRGASWTCDVTRAKNELAFEPAFPLAERVAQTTAWYRQNGWIS